MSISARWTVRCAVLALVAASAGPALGEDKRPLKGLENLVGYDWNADSSGMNTTFTFIESSDSALRGKIWAITSHSVSTIYGTSRDPIVYEAFKGSYEVFWDSADEDCVAVRAAFQKHYYILQSELDRYSQQKYGSSRRSNAELDWNNDVGFLPMGCWLQMPVSGDAIPKSRMQLTAKQLFWVDSDGKQIVRRQDPFTLLEKISGVGEVMTPSLAKLPFLDYRRTLKCTPVNVRNMDFSNFPPPGYPVRGTP